MRVLVVSNIDSTQPFGQFTRPFFLGRGLTQLGWEVYNVGIECSRVDFGPARSVGSSKLRSIAGAVRAISREWEPDLIYAHQNLPGVAALMAGTGKRVVADFHSLPSREWLTSFRSGPERQRPVAGTKAAKAWAAELLLAARAHHLIAAGAELADDMIAAYPVRKRPTVVPNGVDPVFLKRQRGASPFTGAPEQRHVVAVIPGSSTPANVEALHFLRECASQLHEDRHPISFHVLGSHSGPGDDHLAYHGTFTQPDLKPWVAHADACLLPYPASGALRGGARNKLLEALAGGQRVVTTTEGLRGRREAQHWPGVFVGPDDPAGFADVLRHAVLHDAPVLDHLPGRLGLDWDTLAAELAQALIKVPR